MLEDKASKRAYLTQKFLNGIFYALFFQIDEDSIDDLGDQKR